MIAQALLYVQLVFGGSVYAVPPADPKAFLVQSSGLPECRPYELDINTANIDTYA